MQIAIYVRVSSQHQAQTGTIQQQLERLQTYCDTQQWAWEDVQIFRDDGYSGATLKRPGLERLRAQVAQAHLDRLVVTAPDRLARKYVHQVLLLEELERGGCVVEFLDRPMNTDPHDQLLLQIRGAVAEYERTLIAERMRRGRQQKYVAGTLLPWGRLPYGYQSNPERPRDPAGLRLDDIQASHIRMIFAHYLEPGHSLLSLGRHLQALQIPAPKGGAYWSPTTLRGILTNPVYTGVVYAGTERNAPKQRRLSRLRPVGLRPTTRPVPPEEWIRVAAVPAIVTQEQFDMVQLKLKQNQQFAARNNKSQEYLLRGLISCGQCQGACFGRSQKAQRYYCCRRTQADQIQQGRACPARFIPVSAVDTLVWQDLYTLLQTPELLIQALQRAQSGAWLPQELQARQSNLNKAAGAVQNQIERLTEAYLAGVLGLDEYHRRRRDLESHGAAIATQIRQLEITRTQQLELTGVAASMTEFCQRVAAGLEQATFEQQRHLVELLIDCVVVTGDNVEIRYVIPTSPQSEQVRFCQLLTDYSTAM